MSDPARNNPHPISLSDLRAKRSVMTRGRWELWTSNSFRRITAEGQQDGGVLSGTLQRHDNHPDLGGQNCLNDLNGIIATHNAMDVLIEAVGAAIQYRDASPADELAAVRRLWEALEHVQS